MSIEQNKKTVLEFCRYLSARDLDPMFDLLTEDSIWSGVDNPRTFKYGGPRNKKENVDFIGGFLRSFREFRFDVQSTTAEDDRVAVEATSSGIGLNGNNYANSYMLMFRLADGKIVNIVEFFDQIEVLEFEKAS